MKPRNRCVLCASILLMLVGQVVGAEPPPREKPDIKKMCAEKAFAVVAKTIDSSLRRVFWGAYDTPAQELAREFGDALIDILVREGAGRNNYMLALATLGKLPDRKKKEEAIANLIIRADKIDGSNAMAASFMPPGEARGFLRKVMEDMIDLRAYKELAVSLDLIAMCGDQKTLQFLKDLEKKFDGNKHFPETLFQGLQRHVNYLEKRLAKLTAEKQDVDTWADVDLYFFWVLHTPALFAGHEMDQEDLTAKYYIHTVAAGLERQLLVFHIKGEDDSAYLRPVSVSRACVEHGYRLPRETPSRTFRVCAIEADCSAAEAWRRIFS